MNRPAPHTARQVSADRPTATYPTGRPAAPTAYPLPEGWRIDPAGYLPQPSADGGAATARLQEADATPTQVFPVRPLAASPALFPEVGHEGAEGADAAFTARTGARVPARARARVYHTPARGGRPTGRRERLARRASRRERVRRHLRRALTAIALAAALLSVLQAYAAQGITSARQTALAARNEGAVAASSNASSRPAMSGQTTPAESEWVTQDSGAPYSATNPSASPLSLPRCTTAPDTPMPCLAHVSANSDRAVILEEDGSLTALVPSHTR